MLVQTGSFSIFSKKLTGYVDLVDYLLEALLLRLGNHESLFLFLRICLIR